MTFTILSTHLQLGHSVPSSMWMTQHNPDKPFSVFTFQPHTFTLSDSLQCVWFFLSQAVFSALGLFGPVDPLPTSASHPLALVTKLLVPFQSPLPGAALALTTLQAVFPASSLYSGISLCKPPPHFWEP